MGRRFGPVRGRGERISFEVCWGWGFCDKRAAEGREARTAAEDAWMWVVEVVVGNDGLGD